MHIVETRIRVATHVLKDTDCPHCNILTTDQQAKLATPSYEIRKEKRYNKSDNSDKQEEDGNSATLIDLTVVLVLGAVNE